MLYTAQMNTIISEYGLGDNEDLRDALTEAYMRGALDGGTSHEVYEEALGYFDEDASDED